MVSSGKFVYLSHIVREAEVREMEALALGAVRYQYVFRLNVAVDNSLAMYVCQRFTHVS